MFHLFSVGCVVVITDKAHYCRAICGLHNVVSSGPDTAVAGHKGEQQWTQETALWGAGAREITLEVLSPTRTDWGLSVRKSSSQLYRGRWSQAGPVCLPDAAGWWCWTPSWSSETTFTHVCSSIPLFIQAFSLACVVMFFITLTSSMHLWMYADTDYVYSSTHVWWLSVAPALNISQSVHLNQSCNASMAPADQHSPASLCFFFIFFFLLISRGLYAEISITERWSEELRWGRGAALNAFLMLLWAMSSVLFPLVAKSTYWWKWGNTVFMLAWLKSPTTVKTPPGCVDCSSLMEWYTTFRAFLVLALGGMNTAMKMITVNSQGR